MVNALFEMGRQGFLDGSLDWDTQAFSAALLNIATATDTAVKAISSSTAASPIQITTSTAHGFANGDLVFIDGHSTGTNNAANGFWLISGASGSVFNLTNPLTSANTSAGQAAGGATGYVVNYGQANTAVSDNWDDFDGCLIGAKVPLTSPTKLAGVADAADTTFTSVSGSPVQAVIIFQDTGTASTSRLACLITGKFIVTCAATTTATTIPVEPLTAAIPNGAVLTFNGAGSTQVATLSSLANVGDRALTVASTTVTAGNRALAPATGSGLPVTPNGGNILVTWQSVPISMIFKL